MENIKKCICEWNDFEDGDWLYTYSSTMEGTIILEPIKEIHFCPKCGKRLPIND